MRPNDRSDRVLVVDDEPMIRALVGRILHGLGYSSETAGDGAEAIASVAAGPADFAVVLLDATLPGCKTEDVFDQLRVHAPGLPVVMMSGCAVDELRERFDERGASGYLAKPFDRVELDVALCRAIEAAL